MIRTSSRSVVIVVHKLHANPDDDLVQYLNNHRYDDVLHIKHQFSDIPTRKSYFTWYKKGGVYQEEYSPDFHWFPEPLIYLKEFFYTWFWIFRSKIRWERYIGMDGLCSAFGILLRGWLVQRVICWNIDFVPERRFASRIKNFVYRSVNVWSFRRVDEMWDHSEKMVEAKQAILGLRPEQYRSHRVVPLGVWVKRIPTFTYANCKKHTLVFMGHLIPKQGVQLVLQAISRILRNVTDFSFLVIGTGSYYNELVRIAQQLGVWDHVMFTGAVPDDRRMERMVAKCSVAIAPYIKSLDTFTQYGADPGKIKIYLACGLPVLVTDVPWNAKLVDREGCGAIIHEDISDIADRVVKYLTDAELNNSARRRARALANEMDNEKIFLQLNL